MEVDHQEQIRGITATYYQMTCDEIAVGLELGELQCYTLIGLSVGALK